VQLVVNDVVILRFNQTCIAAVVLTLMVPPRAGVVFIHIELIISTLEPPSTPTQAASNYDPIWQ
jgi:hypothetical protein